MSYISIGSEETIISDEELQSTLSTFLDTLGPRDDVCIIPPDYTRFPSQAGKITRLICEHLNFIPNSSTADGDDGKGDCKPDSSESGTGNESTKKQTSTSNTIAASKNQTSSSSPDISILPALGTHVPMTQTQIQSMFGEHLSKKEPNPFLVHDWRNDVVTIGHAPPEMVSEATNGLVSRPWPAQLNKHVWEKRIGHSKETSTDSNNGGDSDKDDGNASKRPRKTKHDSLILSIGQVVPHEVMGMANFNKNLFVGVGGLDAINLSHFIGAVHGMERMMGRKSNPLRSILNYASEKYLQKELDLWYILTVMGRDDKSGNLVMRGLYIGKDIECYNNACDLSLKVNFTMLDRPPKKMVVYLDGDEFHSTWLGNKAIYRTRMAIADEGELLILAPGVKQFGEDGEIDKLIRQYGYIGTPKVMKAMEENKDLQESLSTVAHLIHGSSEGRFNITYCPGHLTKEEIEGVGFQYASLEHMLTQYDLNKLEDGWNSQDVETSDGTTISEEFYFIRNPALGLWAFKDRFEHSDSK